jgi:hypothetical protein
MSALLIIFILSACSGASGANFRVVRFDSGTGSYLAPCSPPPAPPPPPPLGGQQSDAWPAYAKALLALLVVATVLLLVQSAAIVHLMQQRPCAPVGCENSQQLTLMPAKP